MDICPWKEGSIQPTDAKKTFQLSLVFDKNNWRHKKDVENVDNIEGVGEKRDFSDEYVLIACSIVYGNYSHHDRKDIRLDW